MTNPPLPERPLQTPSREDLLKSYAGLEEASKVILAIEVIAVVVLTWLILRRPPSLSPEVAWFSGLTGGLGIFYGFLFQLFLKKKRLHELRSDVRFGVHTPDSLQVSVERVFDRLGLPRNAAPVFVTRAKDVNASAMRCELIPGFRLINGVYLNRSIIHLLDEAELETVIGHELGHVFPYAPILSRCYLLHGILGAIASIWLAAYFDRWGVTILAPFLTLWVIDRIIAWPWMRLGRGIEFLCDDFGALAAGLLPALSCEMKMNAEHETRQALLTKVLEAKLSGAATPINKLLDLYEQAVPFGESDPAVVRAELQRLLDTQKTQDAGISVSGFLDYIRGSNSPDQRAELKKAVDDLKKSLDLPLVIEDRTPWLKGSTAWTPELAEALVSRVEGNRAAVLFREADEIPGHESTHPSVSRRVLFLWRNRNAYPLRVV